LEERVVNKGKLDGRGEREGIFWEWGRNVNKDKESLMGEATGRGVLGNGGAGCEQRQRKIGGVGEGEGISVEQLRGVL
jgi:hypothetical protein